MRLGIISDTHDDLEAIDQAFNLFEEHEVDLIIHCGDWVEPATFKYFGQKAKEAQIPVKAVLGNNEKSTDLDEFRQIIRSDEYPIEMSDDMYDLTFEGGGKEFALCHGHDEILLEALSQSGEYEVIFRGHTHAPKDYFLNETRIINPGAVCKLTMGAPTKNRGIAIYEVETKGIQFLEIS